MYGGESLHMSEVASRTDLPNYLVAELACAQFTGPPIERCTSEVALLHISGRVAVDRVLRDASRIDFRGREREILREGSSARFRVAVESIPSRRALNVAGLRKGDEDATTHVHILDRRIYSCIMSHYSISHEDDGPRLREDTEVRSRYASGRPVVSPTYRYNPFRAVTGFAFRNRREQAMRDILSRAETSHLGSQSASGTSG
jgi:hypothetical protein